MNIIDVKSSRDKQSASTKLERSRFESELGVTGGNAPLYVGMTISALLLYLESVSGAWADVPAPRKPKSNGEETGQGVNTYDLAAQSQSYNDEPAQAAQDPLVDRPAAGRVAARAAMRDGYALGSNSLTEFTPSSIGPTNGPVAFSVFPTNDNPLPEISAPAPRRAASGAAAGSAGGGSGAAREADADEQDDKEKTNQRPVTSGPLRLQAQFMNTAVLLALTDLVRNASDPDGDVLGLGRSIASSGELRLTGEGFVFSATTPGEVTVTYEITDGKQVVLQTAIFEVHEFELFQGTAGDDRMSGTSHRDHVEGHAGNDVIDAGADKDQVLGGAGNDLIYGGDGDDILGGDAGDDIIFAGAGNDIVSGGAGNDHLYGEAGDDILVGDAGDDFLDGGIGADRLDGGTGNDTLISRNDNATDFFDGGEGSSDALDLSTSSTSVTLNLRTGTVVYGDVPAAAPATPIETDAFVNIEDFDLTDHDDTIIATIDAPSEQATRSVLDQALDIIRNASISIEEFGHSIEVESFNGNGGIDTLDYTASAEDITFELAEGIVYGQDIGIDLVENVEVFTGGAGNDVFAATEAPEQIFSAVLGDGEEVAPGDAHVLVDETLATEATLEVSLEAPVNNTFAGGAGEDTLSYEAATESVTIDIAEAIAQGEEIGTDSFTEIETFVGGAAADTFLATEGPVAEEARVDHTFIGGAGEDTLSYEDATESVTINLAEAIAQSEEIGTDSFAEIETFVGGAAADTFLATEGPVAEEAPIDNTFIGGAGEDTLSYEDATESVTIDLAEAIAEGEEIGTDNFSEIETFVGGAADDTFLATEESIPEEAPVNHTFIGGDGEDTLSYEDATQSVTLVFIDGTASGTEIGSDTFSGIENFILTSGNDTVIACGADNGSYRNFTGGDGYDTLSYAGTSSEILIDIFNGTVSSAGETTDTFNSFENVVGGDADDTIIFGVGVVSIDGGGGSDTFIFMSGDIDLTSNSNSGSGNTEIRNFEVGDVVRLDRFDIFNRAIDQIENAFEDFIDSTQGNGDGEVYGDDIPIRIRTELAEEMWRTFIDADFDRDSVYEFSISIDGNHDLIITQTNNSNSSNGHA
jgi:Ca2+-binding RTX toxin-like protein